MGDLISTSPFSTTMRVANPRAIHLRLPFDKLLIEDTTGILDRNILISNCHYNGLPSLDAMETVQKP